MNARTPQYIDKVDEDRLPERGLERSRERKSDRGEERRLERPQQGVLTQDGQFAIDPSRVPPGMTFNWKRFELLGMQDKRNQVTVAQYHWQPVPHKMQPHILGHLCDDPESMIEVGGLVLMMRPTYLCDEAELEASRNTAYMTEQQLQSLKLSSREQVGDRFTKIKKTVVTPQTVD